MGKTILTTLFFLFSVSLFGQRIFVKENAVGTGSSWIDATGDLQSALASASFGVEIWVASGKYTPTDCSTCGSVERNTSFVIKSGTKIYGGFAGFETSLNERDPELYATILSGDIDRDNTPANNSYTIVFTENVSNQTLIDGFILSDANADFVNVSFGDLQNSGGAFFNKSGQPGDASHPQVKNCVFENNSAAGFGAAFYTNGSFGASNTPVFENVRFENNIAGEEGGAFYGNGSFGGLCNPTFINCEFRKNKSLSSNGGAFSLTGAEEGTANALFEDCLFRQNEAAVYGGSVFSFGKSGQSNSTMRRCTFQLNKAIEGGAIYSDGSFSGYATPVFENCFFDRNTAENSGGAFYGNGIFQGVTSPIFKECRFFKNKAIVNHGGAISNSGSEDGTANAVFEDCEFDQNETHLYGGAIFNFGLKGHTNPIIKRCVFTKNKAEEGGGIYFDASFGGESNSTVEDCVFKENEVVGDGGAIYTLSSGGGLCQGNFVRCVFEKNTCVNAGGAVLNNGADGGSCIPNFTNCSFIENSTPNYGAAMYNIGNSGHANPSINNCLFAKNTAFSAGAIYNLGSNSGESSPRITNCTFFGNKAAVGSTIYCNAENTMGLSAPTISNSIFYGNDAANGKVFRLIYGKPTVEFCLFDIDSCEVLNDGLNGEVNCGAGLIFSDEMVFEDTLNGNYRLKNGASIIDAGNSQATQTANIQEDLDGNPRIVNSVVDYGAYEFMSAVVLPPSISEQPSDQVVCEGETITLSIVASSNVALDYQWKKDGTPITGATSSVLTITVSVMTDAGNYACEISNSAGWIQSDAAVIVVNESVSPSVSISNPDSVLCEGEEIEFRATPAFGGTAPVFDWKLNNISTGEISSVFKTSTLKNSDIVKCEMTSNANCATTLTVPSNEVQVEISDCMVSTEGLHRNQTITVFPNPIGDYIDIYLSNLEDDDFFVKIFNTQGSEIARKSVFNHRLGEKIRFEAADFPKGIYFINIASDSYSTTQLVIKN